MTNCFEAIRLFIRVARTRSFSEAAREKGVSQPTVSRAIAGLEKEVGVPLLARTSRTVTLTEAGAEYFSRVENALHALDEAAEIVRGTSVLSGTLRIGTATSFGRRYLIPKLADFMSFHPQLRVNITLTDERQNLVAEGIDVALRFGALEDSSAVARKIHSWPRIAAASPAYVSRAGLPQSPADLANFHVFAGPGASGAGVTLRRDGKVSSVRVESRFTFSTNEGRIAAATAGMGIVVASQCSCAQELSEGKLVRLLEDWDFGQADLHAVYAMGRQAKPAARALTDFLIRELKTEETSAPQHSGPCSRMLAAPAKTSRKAT
ncbi:LysR family transcriptional regulator [Caenimonas soli]|uniref:LysR family transcriptional regulator n=1 Tax=Caenimonas soli TaxID=2735555 RepID=UPI0015574D76|nr:LysR family transcriptional regulator [Caenimonas soli]NPC58511.1 LysR family transcriptional regulator [Caenimonas soli]